ncbi:MAG: F0F1 ATP synthase subunit A [Candidatus Omnitrophica bacterium]|nr:F0F1 ATP synthase subunit A [Candidatus Omnitrophota bacterium]
MTAEENVTTQSASEFPNLIGIFAHQMKDTPVGHFLHTWESAIYSLLIVAFLATVAFKATRKHALIPGRLQNFAEFFVTSIDDFVCSILGPQGRKYTPFIGTLFIYILVMNLLGLVPFLKSPTSEWSNTLGLGLIVFAYVQYTAFKELGLAGYADHMMGKPRGVMAWTIIMPVFMFALHLIGEIVRPFSLSLRLRSNILAEEKLLVVFTGLGGYVGGTLGGCFMYLFDLIGATVQAMVFSVLTLVYFALVLVHEEEHH